MASESERHFQTSLLSLLLQVSEVGASPAPGIGPPLTPGRAPALQTFVLYDQEQMKAPLTMYMGDPHNVTAMTPSSRKRAKPKSAATRRERQLNGNRTLCTTQAASKLVRAKGRLN